jgi:hypothetical protein
MRKKSEAFENFKKFRVEAKKRLGKCVKAIRYNRSGEYLFREFKNYLSETEIVSQLTTSGSPYKIV